jgi:hypothetical protein
MALPLVTLRKSFPKVFEMRDSVSVDALEEMVLFRDDYNTSDGVYRFGAVSPNERYVSDANGNYKVYGKRFDVDKGADCYDEIISVDQCIQDSTSLYLKVAGVDSKYVDIYSLYRLDSDRIFSGSDDVYGNIATRVVAVLYSISCRKKHLMRQYIRDIEAVAEEQKIIGYVSELLKAVQSDLNGRDASIKDSDEMHLATLPPPVWAFMAKRALYSIGAVKGLDSAAAATLEKIIGVNVGEYSPAHSFEAWTAVNTIMRHGDLFLSHRLQSTINLPANCEDDPFASCYWCRSLEAKDNQCKSIMGTGDHWLFDPRLHDKTGRILDVKGGVWDGNDCADCAYFPWFGNVGPHGDACVFPENSVAEDGYDTYSCTKTKNKDSNSYSFVWSDTPDARTRPLRTSPDYAVRWYGASPPRSALEFERGLCHILSRRFGSVQFMPDGCFAVRDGAVVFSDAFVENHLKNFSKKAFEYDGVDVCTKFTLLSNGGGRFAIGDFRLGQLGGVEDPNRYDGARYVEDDTHLRNGPMLASGSGWSSVSTAHNGTPTCLLVDGGMSYAQGAVASDYWPIPTNNFTTVDNAYEKFVLKPVRDAMAKSKFSADKLLAQVNSIHIYADQIGNESNARSAIAREMQMESQQPMTEASTILRVISRTNVGTVSRIR